ncbi:IS256 family transposase [Butyricimonas sp. An62]|uniref:IS256 family transposase n=1 Tax=Butyricimonas sp. An62 TaxID=1965649 RepID=UPI000B37F8D3|nr:IS256 family transposase [Butyricimonas sp. An62]OUN62593.1 IS256 family transposase [Butyricimonas sp. An62]OUN64879.1 IS256 family transposase [Butyricimonas sp. An62]
MEFTHEQISEIISEITNGELGLQGLVKQGLESLMLSERDLHNETRGDVSNGFRGRRVCHGGKVFELRVPRSRNNHFYPMLLGVLKDQEEEAQKLVSSLYCSGLTTEQVGKIYEQFYGKHYSKSQVSRLLNTAREDVNAWLGRELDHRYPIIYIDATYVLTRRDDSVSNEAYYTVLGVKEDRTREVLAVVNFPTESATNWKDVFEDLKERGVGVIDLLVCDGLPGIENVLADTFPKADLQLCTVHLKRNIAGKVKPRDKKQVMEELKQVCTPDQWEISPEQAFQKFKEFIARWQKSYPVLKRYCHDRYRFYFTYFKYEREIRGMIYTTNWIERLNRDYKRVINMRGAMPNPQAVILLMGTVAQNADIYKYPIYNFLESRLFY